MASATAQVRQADQQPPQSRGAVATIAAPRLPYPAGMDTAFGITKTAWRALCESVFPTAKTTEAVVLALSYCKARNLDPFKKPVHIVPIYDAAKGAYVESVWPGIGEHRTTAFRTGTYAGMDPVVFGPNETATFKDKVRKGRDNWETVEASVTFPAWAQVTVYRMVQGQRVSFPGPRVMWREFYSRIGRSIVPNERWQKAPVQMLEKCAEAGALRRAFPEELGEDWTAEESGYFGAVDPKDITPEKRGNGDVPEKEPTRDQFRQRATDVEDETGAGQDTIDQSAATPPADQPADAATDASQLQSAGEQSEPDGWPLHDGAGETIGSFGVTEWLDEFEKLANGAMSPKDRRQYFQNNWDSAKALLADADVPEAIKVTLRKRFEAFLK